MLKKNGLEIWRIGSFPQNLAWIHAAVSEKPQLTDGRTTDACACWQSQAELKGNKIIPKVWGPRILALYLTTVHAVVGHKFQPVLLKLQPFGDKCNE